MPAVPYMRIDGSKIMKKAVCKKIFNENMLKPSIQDTNRQTCFFHEWPPQNTQRLLRCNGAEAGNPDHLGQALSQLAVLLRKIRFSIIFSFRDP